MTADDAPGDLQVGGVGCDAAVVRRAVETGDPLPGTRGFAGPLDGALVRDVLGRYPLFSEPDDIATWSADPTTLQAPERVPAGCRRDADGDERLWTLPDPEPEFDEDRAIADVRAAVVEAIDDVSTELDGGDQHTGRVDDQDDDHHTNHTDDHHANRTDDHHANRTDDHHTNHTDDHHTNHTDDHHIKQSAGDEDTDGPAIAFSGGLDSAILAARLEWPLYVGGFEDSHDLGAAGSAAEALGRDLRVVEFSHADLERAVPEIVRATGRSNAMDVAIAIPLYLVAERAAADGHDRLVVGQGADELFGGYAKVAKAPDDPRLEADTVRGATREVIETLPDQLERDVLALRAAGVEPVAPLLDDHVVAAALRLPGRLLVDGDERKVALRRAADFLPDSVRTREKKAVQYGSLVSRELDRLARRAGFKRRMDDHVDRYVGSLCE